MTDDPDHDGTIEDRLDAVEDEVDDLDFAQIETRIEAIETTQSRLEDDLTSVVESVRRQGEETPHVDSVEALYQRLKALEENTATLRQSVEAVVEDLE